MRCSAYRLDPGRCNSGLRQERVWRAQRPGAENRRYRDLRARQRPHAPRLNRGKARKSGPIRQTLGHFGSYGSQLKLRARHAVLSNEALEQPGTEFRGATDKRAPPRARPSTRKHARSPTRINDFSRSSAAIHARQFDLRHTAANRSFKHPFGDFQAALRLLRRLSAPENPRASSVHHLVHEDASTEPRVPRIKDFFGPVGFVSSSCTMRFTRTRLSVIVHPVSSSQLTKPHDQCPVVRGLQQSR